MTKNTLEEKVKNLSYKIYPKKILGSLDIPEKIESFHDYLHRNRMSHLIDEFSEDYKLYKNSLKKEIELLDKVIGKKKYAIIKTISSYPHITSDLDVLVPNETESQKAKKKLAAYPEQPLPIDINHVISWTDTDEISHSFTWKNMKEVSYEGLKILIPNEKLDTLIRIGHVPFELAEIRLGELLHIFQSSKNIEWNFLHKEAIKMNWEKTFNNMQDKVELLHQQLYNESFFNPVLKVSKEPKTLSFPYHISYIDLAKAMVEKKAWKKIKGARHLVKDHIKLWTKKIFS